MLAEAVQSVIEFLQRYEKVRHENPVCRPNDFFASLRRRFDHDTLGSMRILFYPNEASDLKYRGFNIVASRYSETSVCYNVYGPGYSIDVLVEPVTFKELEYVLGPNTKTVVADIESDWPISVTIDDKTVLCGCYDDLAEFLSSH